MSKDQINRIDADKFVYLEDCSKLFRKKLLKVDDQKKHN